MTTKLTNRLKAKAYANDLEAAARKARAGLLFEGEARKLISEMVERSTGVPLVFETAQSWFNNWAEGKVQTKAKATSARYKQIVRDFLGHLAARAQLNLAAITPSDVQAFRNFELENGKAPGTVKVAMKAIGAAFNSARRLGLITTNPAAALETVPNDTAKRQVFTPNPIFHK